MTDATHDVDLTLEKDRVQIRLMLADIDVKLQQKTLEPWKVFTILIGSAAGFFAAGATVIKLLFP